MKLYYQDFNRKSVNNNETRFYTYIMPMISGKLWTVQWNKDEMDVYTSREAAG